ncbi:MAG TPA: carbamoyl phosphate synthase small subunit, partial [Eubacteriaceae bacterium]|nr:carbamoyl phosphate synthase small subunit [Eubacteriaceae bacterium]
FHKRGCRVTVFPADASAEQIRAVHPDGLFLTNGPGNPKDYPQIIETVRKLVEDLPTAGICLGHQLIALALGGDTEKLTFGHRGANHPVKDLKKDKVYITSQNHGYVVKEAPEQMEITHVSMNDQSIEGMRHKTKPIYSVQFHPEASPGPSDSEYIFEEFVTLLKEGK